MSQIGGSNTFDFLTLTNSARSASMGGNLISIQDNDLNLTFENPSLLNPNNSNQLVLNYVNYFSDINFGYAAYAMDFDKIGTFSAGMHYMNYGTFQEADVTGTVLGEFTAAEYSLNLLYSKPIDSLFNFGINLKSIYSSLETYTSFGMAIDVGVTYYNPKNELLFTAVVKNLGSQIKPYVEDNYEPLPFDLQLGFSKKMKHAPFRISIVAHHLHKFDLTYVNPQDPDNIPDPITGEKKEKSKLEKYGDQAMRHLIFGIEVTPLKGFYIRAGYNHMRHQEMKLFTQNGFAGVSWGVGVKIYKFNFSYGNAIYHAAGASHHFSITTNISDFKKVNKASVE
jgi:hypothetical protein